MEEETIIEKLKNAIERATKNVIMVNSDASYRAAHTATGEIVEGIRQKQDSNGS